MNSEKPVELISVRTAAQRLDTTERFIEDAIRRGDLQCIRLNRMRRIPVPEFNAWVASISKAA